MDTLVERMLGRPLEQMYPPRASSLGDELIAFEDVVTDGVVAPTTLAARTGEILGLAGQVGSGAEGLLRAAAGVQPVASGTIRLGGRPLRAGSRVGAIGAGIAYCSSDRKHDGLFAVRPVRENLSAPALPRVSPRGWISRRLERTATGSLARFFKIDDRRLDQPVATFSGGNQQKVALGKWLGIEPKVLLVEEPTRGVDVGARAEIYAHIRALAERGLAVVFVSSDLPEVLGLADTVATFYRGRLVRVARALDVLPREVMRDVTHPQDLAEVVA
jgi:ABC-type sugar transport system ATPase subunit